MTPMSEKIRKMIKKKVYQPIMENPELGPKLAGTDQVPGCTRNG